MPTKKSENLITTVGRRKTAVARVFLEPKKGEIIVNGQPIDTYFNSEKAKILWKRPFQALGISKPESSYNVSVKVTGAGKPSQLEAVTLGIARALARINAEENTKILRGANLLTRDPRMVERKKPFLRKARKTPQYSKR